LFITDLITKGKKQQTEKLDVEYVRDTLNGQFITIVDLEGLSTAHLFKPLLDLFNETEGIDMSHYPENLGAVYIVNAPRIFNLIWSLVKVSSGEISFFFFLIDPVVRLTARL